MCLPKGLVLMNVVLREQLGLRVRVQTVQSVMAVAKPHLFDHSFARMDYYGQNDFNHLFHDSPIVGKYSIIADSHSFKPEASEEELAQAASRIRVKAEKYFGRPLPCSEMHWYSCKKTEFIMDDETKRNYSYWFEPTWDQGNRKKDASSPPVSASIPDLRVNEPRLAEEKVRALKLDDVQLRTDSWILRKWLHFGMLNLRDMANAPSRVGWLNQIEPLLDDFRKRCSYRPNFLCVLPGKFTMFSSLAHQVCIEMLIRGAFGDNIAASTEPGVCQQTPVALPRAEALISKGGNS